jgi:stage V sporulation protein G
MKITEVRIFPVESRDGKLKAFATMTFDDWFVVRNVKIIQGNNGFFVAMPSRKAVDSCPKCRFKNARGSRYCNQCGAEIAAKMPVANNESAQRSGAHMDIAHPIKQECRVYIQEQVLEAYNNEKTKQLTEGGEYKPQSVEDLDEASKGLELSTEGSKDIEL